MTRSIDATDPDRTRRPHGHAEDLPEAVVDGVATFIGKPRARGWIHVYAAVVAAISAPLWYLWLNGADLTVGAVLAIALLLLYRHRSNIRRLLAGEEARIGRDAQGT